MMDDVWVAGERSWKSELRADMIVQKKKTVLYMPNATENATGRTMSVKVLAAKSTEPQENGIMVLGLPVGSDEFVRQPVACQRVQGSPPTTTTKDWVTECISLLAISRA